MSKSLLSTVFLYVFIQTVCSGQYDLNIKTDTTNSILPRQLSLPYLSGSSFLEKYNSIDVGLMKGLKNGHAIGAEIGYIFSIASDQYFQPSSRYKDVNGFKTYFYYRFLIDLGGTNQIFIDIEPQFYWATFNIERIVGYLCNDEFGDCGYYRYLDAKVNRFVPGLNFKLGKIFDYDPLYFTIFLGSGIRNVTDFSEDMRNPEPDKLFDKKGEIIKMQVGTIFNLRFGFQVAYKIWN